jgi:hypothetical protein
LAWKGNFTVIGFPQPPFLFYVAVLQLILDGKPQGKRPGGRSRRRCEDNIGMDLKKIRWEGMDWIYLDQDRCQW